MRQNDHPGHPWTELFLELWKSSCSPNTPFESMARICRPSCCLCCHSVHVLLDMSCYQFDCLRARQKECYCDILKLCHKAYAKPVDVMTGLVNMSDFQFIFAKFATASIIIIPDCTFLLSERSSLRTHTPPHFKWHFRPNIFAHSHGTFVFVFRPIYCLWCEYNQTKIQFSLASLVPSFSCLSLVSLSSTIREIHFLTR